MADIVNNNNGVCDLKCKYTFNYKDSSTSIKSFPGFLSFTYETFNPEPVTYNSTKYQAQSIYLFVPSLNSYNGKKADAEIIIDHFAPTGGIFYVAIPIMKSNTINKSSLFFSKIIDNAFFNKSAISKKYVKIEDKINLNDVIPMKKYYADTTWFDNERTNINVIVFSIDDNSYINMTMSSYAKLVNLINPHNNPVIKSDPNNLPYVNLGGPSTTNNENGEIYIDCKPVSEDGKLIGESKNSSTPTFDDTKLDKIIKSSWFKILIPSLFLIIIIYFIIKMMNNFSIKDAISKAKMIVGKKAPTVSTSTSDIPVPAVSGPPAPELPSITEVAIEGVKKGGKSMISAIRKK